ncbi:unannotated protein [freshwater metagenome]|uniref:Unannotated protein n=1 Tax=freshwater metagenome TaxID=449393 RepID=A0A6J6E126_9ZZZZ
MCKDHSFMILERADEFREFESGSDPIDVGEAISQRFTGRFLAVGVIGESTDRISMDMIDMFCR